MDNQHRKISGYRELTSEEIALMNDIKSFGPQLEDLVKRVDEALAKQALNAYSAEFTDGTDSPETARIDAAQPSLWLEEGRVSLQKGLMFLTRAVAQPTFF